MSVPIINMKEKFNRPLPSAHWDKIAPIYEDVTGHTLDLGRNIVSRIIKMTGCLYGSSVLDIGCGTGTLSIPFTELGYQVTAVDSSPVMCLQTQKKSDINANLIIVYGDFHEITGQFDLVCAGFCPEITSLEAILMMENLSRKFCAIVTSNPGPVQEIKSFVWKKVTGDEFVEQGHADAMVDILKKSGRKITVSQCPHNVTIKNPQASLTEVYSSILAEKGYSREDVISVIDEFFSNHPQKKDLIQFEKNIRIISWRKQ